MKSKYVYRDYLDCTRLNIPNIYQLYISNVTSQSKSKQHLLNDPIDCMTAAAA